MVSSNPPSGVQWFTYHAAGGSPRAAHGGQAGAVVPSARDKHHVVFLHRLVDDLTDPPGPITERTVGHMTPLGIVTG